MNRLKDFSPMIKHAVDKASAVTQFSANTVALIKFVLTGLQDTGFII